MRRILVADDNEVSRELVRWILEPSGWDIVESCNGREVLDRIHEARPDLVLLDIQMPVMDGLAVIRELRRESRFRDLPVLALTAYAMENERRQALAAGFDGYITKPVDASELRREVARALQLPPHRAARAASQRQ